MSASIRSSKKLLLVADFFLGGGHAEFLIRALKIDPGGILKNMNYS